MSSTPLRSLPAPYWRQWSASAISNLGDGINFVALPLLALSLTDDERLLSLTTFATGTRTSVMKVSQKGEEPLIKRIGFTSTPGDSMSIRK